MVNNWSCRKEALEQEMYACWKLYWIIYMIIYVKAKENALQNALESKHSSGIIFFNGPIPKTPAKCSVTWFTMHFMIWVKNVLISIEWDINTDWFTVFLHPLLHKCVFHVQHQIQCKTFVIVCHNILMLVCLLNVVARLEY